MSKEQTSPPKKKHLPSPYLRITEQTEAGAVVRLLELPKLLKAQRLPVQSPATALTHFQSTVGVLHAFIILSLVKAREGEVTFLIRKE